MKEANPVVVAVIQERNSRPYRVSYRKYCENARAQVSGPLLSFYSTNKEYYQNEALARESFRDRLSVQNIPLREQEEQIAKWHYERPIPLMIPWLNEFSGITILPFWRNGKRVPTLKPAGIIKVIGEYDPERTIKKFLDKHSL